MLKKNRRAIVVIITFAGMVVTTWAIQARLTARSMETQSSAVSNESKTNKKLHPVVINTPNGPDGVETGEFDFRGNKVVLECSACHEIRKPNAANATTQDLNEFHRGLSVSHGKLMCIACHNADDGYETLHLADGRSVEYADTVALCAQCHGPQFRDYQNGSHGGMTGYWDRTQGSRQRNHCVDCHDPHAPQYPMVLPAAGPNDRFQPVDKDTIH